MSLVVGTFVFSLVGGIVPILNVEAYLLSVSALSPGASVWPVAVAAALGQMAGKSLLYLAGRGLLHLPARAMKARIEAATARLARAESGSASGRGSGDRRLERLAANRDVLEPQALRVLDHDW